MSHMVEPVLGDVLQWEVRTWARALPFWENALPAHRPARALAIGEREGGLALWLATKGFDVTCTDLKPFPEATRALHTRYGVADRITYAQADATSLQFLDEAFDAVIFKSVLGALESKAEQGQAIREMHRVLRPGGVLLFAENLAGSPIHGMLRRRFVRWASYWRYLQWPQDADLFAGFHQVRVRCTGCLAPLGRSEAQRDLLARIDGLFAPLIPGGWHTMIYGTCAKGEVLKSGEGVPGAGEGWG